MTADLEVINVGRWPHAEHQASRLDDEWVKWQADRTHVDKVLARAGMFQGVEPGAVSALTAELHPVDFKSGHTVFVEGEPGERRRHPRMWASAASRACSGHVALRGERLYFM